jgi:microcystin-dependent protein
MLLDRRQYMRRRGDRFRRRQKWQRLAGRLNQHCWNIGSSDQQLAWTMTPSAGDNMTQTIDPNRPIPNPNQISLLEDRVCVNIPIQEALLVMFIVGEIRAFAFPWAENDPLEKAGWLECDGRSLDKHKYKDLEKILGKPAGSPWGGDSQSESYRLPDLRGMFLRGWNHASTNDPDASTRKYQYSNISKGDHVGSIQSSANLTHSHDVDMKTDPPGYPIYAKLGAVTGSESEISYGNAGGPMLRGQALPQVEGRNESRPINASVVFRIYAGPKTG